MERTPIHLGEILAHEIAEIGITARTLAAILEVPPNWLYRIMSGKRNLTAPRSGQYFGMSAHFPHSARVSPLAVLK
jgi:plasmid maintenance system antidote protein VapI